MKLLTRSILVIFLTTAAGASACSASRPIEGRAAKGNDSHLSVQGLSVRFTIQRYSRLADLVIRGVPTSDVVRPFTSNGAIPDSAKDDEMYGTAGYHDVTVRVTEYLKGEGGDTVSVRRLDPPPGVGFSSSAPEPELDKEQVMFLSQGEGLWSGGYLVLGEQSLAPVVGGAVKLPGGSVLLSEFRERVIGAAWHGRRQSISPSVDD